MWMTLVTAALLALALPATAASQAAQPAPYRLEPLKGDAFTAPPVVQSEFDGDYARVGYVPAAVSAQVADALIASTPAPQQQELTFEYNGRPIKYLAVGDLSKPAKMIFVYVHGFNDNRSQGMSETLFGGAFARLKRLAVENDAIYLSPDFSGFGRKAEGQVAALIADYAGRSPGAPVFVACLSAGGKVCWRLAESADGSSPIRGILILSASVDRGFVKQVGSTRVGIYLGTGTKDTFSNWKSHDALFRDVKAAVPDYPIRLAIFDEGEHATAVRLTDWVTVLNWMLTGAGAPKGPNGAISAGGAAEPAGGAAEPPCPRPRPEPGATKLPPARC